MQDSARLHTTPGQFDYPPASVSDPMDPPHREQHPPNPPRRPHLQEQPANQSGRRRDGTPPWIPSSPETRRRMQRVLRHVHELQDSQESPSHAHRPSHGLPDGQDLMRDFETRVSGLQDSQVTAHDIGMMLQESEATLRQRASELDVQRIRQHEEVLRSTDVMINHIEDHLRASERRGPSSNELSIPPVSISPSAEAGGRSSFTQWEQATTSYLRQRGPSPLNPRLARGAPLPNPARPLRSTLREVGERLRRVNDGLRHLVDRPMSGGDANESRHVMEEMSRLLFSPSENAEYHFDSPQHPAAPSTSDESVPRSVHLQNALRHGAASQAAAQLEQLLSSRLQDNNDNAQEESSTGLTNSLGAHMPNSDLDISRASSHRARHGNSLLSSRSNPHPGPTERDDGFSPRKRRRLDVENPRDLIHPIQYGYEGQVVSGRLKLQLVSSDGGIVDPPVGGLMSTTYGAENVLKDDQSVYCTKSERCNMVLQHQHQTTFCLERLEIKAPKTGFTDPVREGLIFVSMRHDDLFKKTAQYQIYDFSKSSFARHFPSSMDPERGTGTEIEYPVLQPLRPPRSQDSRRVLRSDLSLASTNESAEDTRRAPETPEHLHGHLDSRDEAARHDIEDSSEATSDDEYPPPAHYSGYATSRMRARDYQRSGLSRQQSHYQDVSARRIIDNAVALNSATRQPRHRQTFQASVTQTPTGLSQPQLTFMVPAARFSMHSKRESDSVTYNPVDGYTQCENSDTMTIRFDPPISGKFILLKMWSPRHGGNIDVQSVVAHGFAGPRYFPSVDKR